VRIVHGNDHTEGLLALKIARQIGAHTAIFLRSPSMTERDYFKYSCDQFEIVAAVGDRFRDRVQAWDKGREIALIPDGICEDEFLDPKPKAATAPKRALVIGSPIEWKGWADLTAAVAILEPTGMLNEFQFDFTGNRPNPKENDLHLLELNKVQCNFLGRVENFRELVRSYDLIINPTRMETFGMAAIEVIAAGVPLISSRTGVIEHAVKNPQLLFPSGKPIVMAATLRHALSNWAELDFDLAESQRRIREKFLVSHSAEILSRSYRDLLGKAPTGNFVLQP